MCSQINAPEAVACNVNGNEVDVPMFHQSSLPFTVHGVCY